MKRLCNRRIQVDRLLKFLGYMKKGRIKLIIDVTECLNCDKMYPRDLNQHMKLFESIFSLGT